VIVAHLGEIGGDPNPDGRADSFTFGGEERRINPDFSELDIIDFMEKAQQVDENDPKAVTMVKDLFRGLVHADDFDGFWAACKKTHQTAESMVKIYSDVLAAMSDRPSKPPSDSSDGRRTTGTTSKEDSYLVVLDQLEGRPDLQAVAVRHQEQRQA
jgi:hypothetical protein